MVIQILCPFRIFRPRQGHLPRAVHQHRTCNTMTIITPATLILMHREIIPPPSFQRQDTPNLSAPTRRHDQPPRRADP